MDCGSRSLTAAGWRWRGRVAARARESDIDTVPYWVKNARPMTSTPAGTTPAPTTSSSHGCAACRRAPRRHWACRHRTRARLPRLRHGRRADHERRGTMDSASPTGHRLCGGRARLAGLATGPAASRHRIRRPGVPRPGGTPRAGGSPRRNGCSSTRVTRSERRRESAARSIPHLSRPLLLSSWTTDGAEAFSRTPPAPPATPVTAPWTERPCVPVPGRSRPRAPGSPRRRNGAATEPAPRHHMPLPWVSDCLRRGRRELRPRSDP